jgi:hypothetical protein
MKRHFVFTVLLSAALGISVILGHYLGNRRGEQTVNARLAEVSGGVPGARPAGPLMPPPPGGAARPSDQKGPRSRDEMRRFLAELKERLLQSGESGGSLMAATGSQAMTDALDGLSLDEVRLALDLVVALPQGMDRSAFSRALIARWAREDAPGALEHFRAHREDAGAFGTLWLMAIMMPWSEKDPAAAAKAFAATLENEDDDILQGSIGNGVYMVAEKLAQADSEAALSHVSDLPEWARGHARTAVAKQVHGDTRDAFLERLGALPDGAEKTAWQRAAASAMAPVDAAAAGQYIDSLGLSEAGRQETTRAVFEKWAQHDTKTATEWAAGRLPDEARADLMAQAVKTWAPREPNECGRWLGSLEPGPQLDRAMAAFAHTVAAKDLESAKAWAERITDAGLRAESLATLERRGGGRPGE